MSGFTLDPNAVYAQAPSRLGPRHLLRPLDDRLWDSQPSDFGHLNPTEAAKAGWADDQATGEPVAVGYPAVLLPYSNDDTGTRRDRFAQELAQVRAPHIFPHDDERTAAHLDVWLATELTWLREDLNGAGLPFVSLVFPWHLYRLPFSEKRVWAPAKDPERSTPPSDRIRLTAAQGIAPAPTTDRSS